MAQLSRTALSSDITSTIYTNRTRLIQGDTVKARLLNINDSSLNVVSDLNVSGGYLGIDSSGRVSVSFISAPVPSGKYLKDDGSWDSPGGGNLNSTFVGVGSAANLLAGTANFTFDPTISGGNIQRLTIGSIGPQIEMYGSAGGSRIETNGDMKFTLFTAGNFIFQPNSVESFRLTNTSKALVTDSGRTIQLGGWIGLESLYGALYFAAVPSGTNYAVSGDDTLTYVNAVSEIDLQITGISQIVLQSATTAFKNDLIVNPNALSINTGAAANSTWFEIGASTAMRSQLRLNAGVTTSTISAPLDGMVNYDNVGGAYLYASGFWQRLNIALPKIRQVWLVNDATDQAAMGGAAAGVYITFQSAYEAAAAIAVANPTFSVVVMVGVTLAASVGNCTPTATRWNQNVSLIGISSRLSVVGDITLTATITALNNTTNNVMFKGVTVGNINGIQGSSSTLSAENCKFGNLSVVSGLMILRRCLNVEIGNITTASTAGLAINTCQHLSIGDISLTGCNTIQINNYSVVVTPTSESPSVYINSLTATNTSTLNFEAIGVFIKNALSLTGINHATSSYIKGKNLIVGTTTTLNFTAGSGNPLCEFEMCRFYSTFTLTNAASLKIRWLSTVAAKLVNVPAGAKFGNVSFYDTTSATPVINGIAASCEFYCCAILGGSLAMDSGAAQNVKFTSGMSSSDQGVGSNITLT